jgi:hypothetical protein
MKSYRCFSSLLVANFALFIAVSASHGQSLGETARKLRQNKQAETSPKVITNDDLREAPAAPAPPEMKSETADKTTDSADKANAETAKNSDDDKDKDSNAEKKKKKSDPEAAQAELDKDWSKQIGDQKQKIADIAHELDLLQRENKLRAAAYYGDAGNRLRNQQSYAEQDRKYQKDIADKQKELDDAKAKLGDLQEEARKAGASAKARE